MDACTAAAIRATAASAVVSDSTLASWHPPSRSGTTRPGATSYRPRDGRPQAVWRNPPQPALLTCPAGLRRQPLSIRAAQYGVYSEVGRLRKVLVCAPGPAHERLTPSNCDDLLFDDVMWVQNARRDHFDFVAKMRERGVEVVELHDLLTETLTIGEAKTWLLDRKI